jgi:hypothetical protein
MMNGPKPHGPSDGFQAPSPKPRRARLRVSCSPHPSPLPQERECGGTALENSDVAVTVPASLSSVLEAHDNQARSYHQSTGECFSLSWGRGLG